GVTNITQTVTVVPPAVLVHFIIVNPSIIPAAINEVKLVMTRLSDGNTYKFAPSHYGKKEGVDKPGAPARVQFEDYWGSILVKPASCSAHRLVFIPAKLRPPIIQDTSDKIFTDLVAGKYKLTVELRFAPL